MDKYLGNKRVLLPAIHEFVSQHCPKAESLCDVFAGTTNVARSFRLRGFRVISNDINRFSFVLASTYLNTRRYPAFDRLSQLKPSADTVAEIERRFRQTVGRDAGCLFPIERVERVLIGMQPAIQALAVLNESSGQHGPITDYFTKYGKRSEFRSVRGTAGKRNYFTEENSTRLDAIMRRIRRWWLEDRLSLHELFFLLTAVLEEVTLVANVNGTFHDFNRDRLWPNAHQDFFLKLPLASCEQRSASLYCQDALSLASHLPAHDVLYIDPPYNFRQYTAYYHFLNFLAAYPLLSSVSAYLGRLNFVRGQHPDDDFASPYSRRDSFIVSLRELIKNTPATFVVLSYYGGRNHWNHWYNGSKPTDAGRDLLRDLFSDGEVFLEYTDTPAIELRRNYQSRVGEKKQMIDEYLFFGRRRKRRQASQEPIQPDPYVSALNQRFGLMEFAPCAT